MLRSLRFVFLILVTIASLVLGPVTPARAATLPAEINKQFTPLQIDAGGTSVLRISIFNPNTFQLTNVAFTDDLVRVQPGLFIDTPNGLVNTCNGTVTALPNSSTISLANGMVPAQTGSTPGQCYIEVNVSSITSGNIINTIPAHNPPADIGLTANGIDGVTPVTVTNTSPASATITVIAVSPPSLTKSFAPNTIFVGDVSVLTIRINNNDVDTNLTGATYTDTLPTGLQVSTPANITRTNCGAGNVVNAPSGGTTITLTNATITPSQDCVVTLDVRGVTYGQYTNTIPAGPANPSSLQTDQGVTNGSPANANLNVQPVGVTKLFSPTTIDAGDTTTLTITLQNPTNTPQVVTSVLDTLPANLTIVGSPTTTCGGMVSYDPTPPASWVFTGATIPASASPPTPNTCTITADLQADLTASGNRTNTIPANSVITGTPGFTNYLATSSTVTINPALTGSKAYASPFAIALGGTNLVTITLNNNSSTAFTDVDFTDTLPGATLGDLTVSNTPAPPATTCGSGTVSNTATTVTLTNGTIAANSSCTITFYVTSTVPGSGSTYENVIPANDITACTAALGCVGNGSNITTGTDLTVVNAPQLPVTVAKSFSPATVAPGQASRLRLTITAPLDIAVSQISITDVLPTGMVVAPNTPPIPAPTESCPGGTLTANPGDTSITFSNLVGDVLNAGASCNIDVYVVVANPGSYDNLVPANTVTTSQGRTNSFDSNTATLRVTSMNMSKAFYPTLVQANGVSTLTITLENTFTQALTNVSVTDDLPATNANNRLIVAPTPNASTTCGGTFTPNAGDSTLTLTGGTIPAQSGGIPGICTINVDVQGLDSSPASQSTQTNTIPITNASGFIASLGVTVNPTLPAQAVLTIRNLSIGVVKGFNPVLVYGGATSTMTVQLINPESTTLTGVMFTDNMALLSSGIILANPPDFNTGTCGGTLTGNPGDSSFSFSGGTILPNSSCTLTLSVVMNVNGNRTNRIPAGAVTTLSGVSSTQATEASLTNLPGVSVNKVFNPNPVQINQVSTLTINITNTSSIPVVNMRVEDNLPGTLPDGVEVANPPNATTTCGTPPTTTLSAVPGSQSIVLTGGNIAGNASCQISVDVVSTRAGLYVNTIPAGALTADGGISNNNPATDSLTVGTLFSLGNRVWFDTNNNSLISLGELGTDGVVVQLYAADGGGLPTGPVLGTQTTSFGGYYRFDNLPEGDYVVVIPADNFRNVGPGDLAPTNPLAGYWSSGTILSGGSTTEPPAPDPDDDLDNTDNGTLQTGPTFTGAVISGAITLGTNAVPVEPTDDDDVPVPNPFGEAVDNRSNRTVDFGFYQTAIGNLVFVDANSNNTYGGADTLLPGAIVQLFASDGTTEINVGPDGIFGTDDDQPGGVVTGSDGLYALSGLPEGDYIVRVTPPAGYQSTGDSSPSDVNDPDFNIDNNDNGIGNAIGPLSSSSGVLTMDAGETGTNIIVTNSTGTTNDLSVDFGFVSISYSLGNRVWFDDGTGGGIPSDGIRNGGEPGIDGVTVNLYRDSDNNGTPDGGVIATMPTSGGGYYRFDNLTADTYIVEVVPPIGYVSTVDAGDPDTDVDDNDDNGVVISGANIRSNPVTLGPGSAEPTGETDPTTNPEAGEAPDNRSNRTVDFGFVTVYSLGNRVWLDDGSGGGGANDGVRNGSEPGIDGITVNLYRDSDNNGIPDGGVIATMPTAGGGYYRFDNLVPGTYIVEVVSPAGYGSSTVDAGDPDIDADDNDDNGVVISGTNIRSNPVTLGPGGSEPTGETDPLTNPEPGEAADNQSNRTVDFGFVTIYSLGNRVWFDTNNNGSVDVGEVGVPNVRVELYRDTGATPGVYDAGDDFVGFSNTNGTGYYRFDGLVAGEYVVVIPPDNFRDLGLGDTVIGDPLAGYLSSGSSIAGNGYVTDSFGPDPDTTVLDNDDNGVSTFVSNILDYVSAQAVTLGPGSAEPTGEADPTPNPGAGESVDNQSDRTVDFGFYRQQLSNQIFLDLDSDGVFTGADTPLAGAIVQLYASNGTTEILVGTDGILGTSDDGPGGVTTLAGGTYLFSGLPAGDYVVKVTPPAGISTIDSADTATPNNNVDNNDNGVGTAAGQASSNPVTLTPGITGVSTTVNNSNGTTLNPSLDFGFNPLFSLGNRVWFDTDNSSTINGAEVGIDNVRVELYRDDGSTPGVWDSLDTPAGFDLTDANGYYRFDGLDADDYVVVIPSSQFGAGGPLDRYWSSGTNIANNGTVTDSTSNDPDNDTDSDDNGITTFAGNNINYVSSQAVTLGPGLSEPINDNDPTTNPEPGEAPNDRTNRTLDFGFYRAELGNQVFWDINTDGLYDAGDVVIPDAEVRLFTGDGVTEILVGLDGVLGTADDGAGVVTTAPDGTYLFGGLPAGNFIVRVTPPAGFASTVDVNADTTTPNNNIDNNDNGVGTAAGQASSNVAALTPGSVNVSNIVTNSTGTTRNPSLDFGFVPDSNLEFSLGNRVWFDTDNSGAINGSEIGVGNVRVELYRDNGGTPGLFDAGDAFVNFTTTDANGYYRFDNLPAGNYVVVIPPSQFGSGGALDGYWNSGTSISASGTITDSISPDPDSNATDSDDNGVTTLAGSVLDYVSSRAVTLGPTITEPTGETDALPNPAPGEEPDNQSNRTLDFGFYRLELSNQIFVDVNNDGIFNAGDLDLAGARVQLFASNGTTEINVGVDGILGTGDDGTGGMVTGPAGTYLFSGLPAGDYIVRVTPPAGYFSTVDVNPDTDTPNNNVNDNDNGVGIGSGQVSSNIFSLVPGVAGPSTTVINSTGTTLNPSLDFGFNTTNGFLKTIAGTSETFTGGANVAIGEIVTYQITIDLAAGVPVNNVVVTDRMDKGLAFVDCLLVQVDGTDVTGTVCPPAVSSITDPGDLAGNPANPGRQVVFNVGNVAAPTAASSIVIRYRAIVLDVIENQDGISLNNAATVTSSAGTLSSSAPNVNIVEPDLAIDKSAIPQNSVPIGTPIQFTLEINHTSPQSTADAFDVVLTDVLPPTLEYIPCSVTYSGLPPTSPATPAYCPGTTNTLTFTWDVFPRGQSAMITFSARLVGSPATNVASVSWTSLPIDPGITGLPVQLSIHNSESTERWYDPLDDVNVYATRDSVTINDTDAVLDDAGESVKLPTTLPATGFAPGVVTTLPEQPADLAYTTTGVWLEIPSIGVTMPIVGVPLADGDWNVSWLASEAGWLNGTAFPGWNGNSGLTGHVTLPNGKPGPFTKLGKLQWGDKIIVHAFGEIYIYEVRENRTIKPYSTSVLQHEEEAWLTLITCKSYNESTNTYADRIAVRAVLVKVQTETTSNPVEKR